MFTIVKLLLRQVKQSFRFYYLGIDEVSNKNATEFDWLSFTSRSKKSEFFLWRGSSNGFEPGTKENDLIAPETGSPKVHRPLELVGHFLSVLHRHLEVVREHFSQCNYFVMASCECRVIPRELVGTLMCVNF